MAQLKLPSIQAITKWAEHSEYEKIGDFVAVFKNGLWYYFNKVGNDYVLKMTSLELEGEK